jgi:hypothetical protein
MVTPERRSSTPQLAYRRDSSPSRRLLGSNRATSGVEFREPVEGKGGTASPNRIDFCFWLIMADRPLYSGSLSNVMLRGQAPAQLAMRAMMTALPASV